MPGAGFLGIRVTHQRRKSPTTGPVLITATLAPASSSLVVGAALAETVNWSTFIDPSNYATSAAGETIASVEVDYIGSTATATAPLADGDMNNFALRVTDTAGNTRVFTVIPRFVVHVPPVAAGTLPNQSLTLGTGVQTLDAVVDFAGVDLTFALSPSAGVSIDAATGLISFETDSMGPRPGETLTVTASNSGGSAESNFELAAAAAIVYSASLSGLTDNATHGLTAQIGTALMGTISPLQGSEDIVHRWRLDGALIGGADTASYTPLAGQNLQNLRYAPAVNGTDVVSDAHLVRHAAPVAGTLVAVSTVQGSGTPQVNLSAGFTGDDLGFSEAVNWASISGSVLTIADEVRNVTLPITATNSGGAATVDLSVEITAPVVVVVAPIADQTITQGTGDATFDLRGVFDNATGYSVTGAGASIDADGYTLRLEDSDLRSGETITVTGSNAWGSAEDVFGFTVTQVAPDTDLVMTIQTTVPDETFTVPFREQNTSFYEGTVDMGAGAGEQVFTDYNSASLSATYATPGTHTIRITGRAFALYTQDYPVDRLKIRTVENFGALSWQDMFRAFNGCANMTSFVAGNTDTSGITNWFSVFNGCTSMITCDISGMDFSSATNLQNTWAGCTSLTFLDTTVIDTSNVQRMDEMLYQCAALAPVDIAGFNLESLVDQGALDDLNFGSMFNFITNAVPLTQAVYDAFLISLASQTLNPGLFFGLQNSPYMTGGAAEAARTALINAGHQFDDAGTTVPDQMASPVLVVDGQTQITATLAADPFNNGLNITRRDLRYATDGTNWTEILDVTGPVVLTGLAAGTVYQVQSRARNFRGTGTWSASATASTQAAAGGYIFSDNANGTVTFTTAGTSPTPSFQDNDDGTVERVF